MKTGQIVFSKCGRDKGKLYVVMLLESGYAYLVDGHLRPTTKPKKKKQKHIQLTHTMAKVGSINPNADVRRALRAFAPQKGVPAKITPVVLENEEVLDCLKPT